MYKNQKSYGGFLEFEAGSYTQNCYHPSALALSNGRACLNYILLKERPRHVYIPFYTCGALLDPFILNNISYTFYSIDENLDPIGLPNKMNQDEYIIYINYFGIKTETLKRLTIQFGNRLIADNCMSFFSQQLKDCYTYNSCRKFFGVPDGAYLYCPNDNIIQEFEKYEKFKYDHLISRMMGRFDICYQQFRENEDIFDCSIYGMSILTEQILRTIDYNNVAEKRRRNFKFLHENLSPHNCLNVILDSESIPHYYPLKLGSELDRIDLAKKMLFVPKLWTDIINRKDSGYELERKLVTHILPLPIDQRYGLQEMEEVVKILNLG